MKPVVRGIQTIGIAGGGFSVGLFLNDRDIAAALNSKAIKIEIRDSQGQYRSIPVPAPAKLVEDNYIQASSVDFTIGRIFHPPAEPSTDLAREPDSLSGGLLQPGHTVVVETLEKITLDGQHGAFGFPPSSVSKNAVLMTNPGHVDPGYSGHLSFTLINMGREPFNLLRGKPTATLLLFRLEGAVAADYAARKSIKPAPTAPAPASPFFNVLNRLAPDFASFTARMAHAAENAVAAKASNFESRVATAESKLDLRRLWLPALIGVVGILISAALSYFATTSHFATTNDTDALRARIIALESKGR